MAEESQSLPLADGAVTLDADRRRRCGYPEVVYGEGKPVEAIAAVFAAQLQRGEPALATRVDPATAALLSEQFPTARPNALARTVRATPEGWTPPVVDGRVAVITAGTTDLPIAEEAAETLAWMGVAVTRVSDVGVAGPHRLRERLAEFESATAIVVVAGMEGALPSVVAGYVACPVIAVPTSVGYGANLGGVAALLSMLNSCASNVAVVNIDAGFKGGYLAGLIATRSGPR
ncbi:N5-carboxyaminoimidazole ribonucleotide mutase [Botrimarina colliarenosi]|uniref:N5-carboxyaminoimidazole ribonucleotide mutase n=1 Tax=Botrimarina colliarenosi TaxID=2528001 RepID=A0A5C6AC83_9BACT|nr:nickel pincer cofactor biosynthesis protein LarB [Botrimarina colliarenosi]TWT97007.1 N5-carboxyaminoimidazole ribonucleotide mutase [Botrimarina colliarenosi]